MSQLRSGELTKIMNLIVKADLDVDKLAKAMDVIVKENIDLRKEDIHFLKFCREVEWGKLTGVLIKDGVPVMADTVRHDVRFDID